MFTVMRYATENDYDFLHINNSQRELAKLDG